MTTIMAKTPDYFAAKTIVITGAASGIGRATALIFAREGANVVCADLNEAGARQTAAAVNAKGSQALAIKVDVTSRGEVNDMIERAIAAFGTVQFLFNSAGAAIRRAKFLDIDDALLEKTFALNVNGTFYAMRASSPRKASARSRSRRARSGRRSRTRRNRRPNWSSNSSMTCR
jgi:NAD(P)-dependent dehydrogenase (short-subunit alcohol dehydrogenase family)